MAFEARLYVRESISCICGAGSSAVVAAASVFTPDALLGCLLTITYTLIYWYSAKDLAINMSWTVVRRALLTLIHLRDWLSAQLCYVLCALRLPV